MLSKVISVAVLGIGPYLVEVEVDITSRGLPRGPRLQPRAAPSQTF